MFKRGTLNIVIEEAATMRELKADYNDLKMRYEMLLAENHAISLKFGFEVQVNNELIDLCRANGIKYRSNLDSSKWANLAKTV